MTTTTTTGSWNFETGDLPYRDQLFKTAMRLTRSAEDSEDLLQETYLKAYRNYHQFQEGTNLKAWLFRIMKNAFVNEYRRRKVRPQYVELETESSVHEAAALRDVPEELVSPEAMLSEGEMDHTISETLMALPHHYRMAVLLVDIQDMSYQEAADILAIPVGTVMSRLYRGRKKLEKALFDFGTRTNYLRGTPNRFRDEAITQN
jgi:RNA polymerase sigma-70 factor (ECF subfamily)